VGVGGNVLHHHNHHHNHHLPANVAAGSFPKFTRNLHLTESVRGRIRCEFERAVCSCAEFSQAPAPSVSAAEACGSGRATSSSSSGSWSVEAWSSSVSTAASVKQISPPTGLSGEQCYLTARGDAQTPSAHARGRGGDWSSSGVPASVFLSQPCQDAFFGVAVR